MSDVNGIKDWQRKKIFAIAKALEIDYENLHALADTESLMLLSYSEANSVIKRLLELQGTKKPNKNMQGNNSAKNGKMDVPGMMTTAQQGKVWHLMYQLKSYDKMPSSASLGVRLCGIINKELKIDASAKEPFKWIDLQNGRKLIEILKRYEVSASKGSAPNDVSEEHGV